MSSLRTQGPITTGVRGYTTLSLQRFSTIKACGYGSRLALRLAGTTELNFEHLSRLQHCELLPRHLRLVQRPTQRDHRRVDCLVGQLERAVMMRPRLLGAAV